MVSHLQDDHIRQRLVHATATTTVAAAAVAAVAAAAAVGHVGDLEVGHGCEDVETLCDALSTEGVGVDLAVPCLDPGEAFHVEKQAHGVAAESSFCMCVRFAIGHDMET